MKRPRPLKSLRKGARNTLKKLARARRAYGEEVSYGVRIVHRDGFHVARRVATADDRVIQDSFANDKFFAIVPDYRPEPVDIILDIGAHIGTFALLAARKVPQGKVYALEASGETFDLLRINVALNNFPNIITSHVALTDKRGSITLYHANTGNWGHSVMARLSSQSENVNSTTLADYMKDHRIAGMDFAKFNCEGAEFPIIIHSAPDQLAKIRRMLILYHCDLVHDYSLKDLTAALTKAQFDVSVLRETSAQRGWLYACRRD